MKKRKRSRRKENWEKKKVFSWDFLSFFLFFSLYTVSCPQFGVLFFLDINFSQLHFPPSQLPNDTNFDSPTPHRISEFNPISFPFSPLKVAATSSTSWLPASNFRIKEVRKSFSNFYFLMWFWTWIKNACNEHKRVQLCI